MLSNRNRGSSSLQVSVFFFPLENRRYINGGGLGCENFGKNENLKSLLPRLILTIQCVLYIKKKNTCVCMHLATLGLSCSMRAPECEGSVVVALGLSCSRACGIPQFPYQGLNPRPLHCKVDS